jgi:hypothetical protein
MKNINVIEAEWTIHRHCSHRWPAWTSDGMQRDEQRRDNLHAAGNLSVLCQSAARRQRAEFGCVSGSILCHSHSW